MATCSEFERSFGSQLAGCGGWKVRGIYRVLLKIKDLYLGFLAFTGRESYRPWVEFDSIQLSEDIYRALEEVLPRLRGVMGEGLRVMIPYITDHETSLLLSKGFHPGATRLGCLMIESGYYLVRDMYYPEGFAEGSPKLVGEGYVDSRWYLESLLEELDELKKHLSRGCKGEDRSCIYAEKSARVIGDVVKRISNK